MKVIDDDDFDHFKKFARKGKNFLKCCHVWVWGGRSPPRNLRYPPFVRPSVRPSDVEFSYPRTRLRRAKLLS